KIGSIAVCGAGTMGRGIAQAAIQSGFETILFDTNEEIIKAAAEEISRSLLSLVQKGKISEEERIYALNNFQVTSDINEVKADLVIEAIIEKLEAKKSLFETLEKNNAESILTSNTSSLSINEIAKGLLHPEKFAGLHFFNPATIMKLVEIVVGENTSEETKSNLAEVVQQMKKTAVFCKDDPGFIVNHVARHYYLEALRLVENGKANPEQIDRILEATGFKMGPFKLMDLIGNDINYAVSNSVYEAMGSPERLKPSDLQKSMVESGRLGKKSGRGYYNYE
ncbi:MAG: 3-hydroxyacyl-CoA dehydrogenase NAD-binding domain-containing protein, partial [Flavitalea sp.]